MTINFAFLAMDQIVNHVAKIHYMFNGQITCPIVIRTVGGGGRQLAATHSQSPEVVFSHFPGLKVVAPSTPADAKGLLKAAIREDDPVFFIEHATLYPMRGEVPDDEDFLVPIGVSDIKREGEDVTLVSYARTLQVALEAAEQLAAEDIEAEVIDLRTLRPLDTRPIVESVRKTNRMVVAEEGWRAYGVGAEIASRVTELAFDHLDAPVRRVAQAEVPLPYNRRLEQMALPQVEDVINAVKDVLYLK
jgi:pyruvate dehydrogenase E1 component beta subunit